MKILYVHIGIPKTGTSAIQNFCVMNRKVFESEGYCYPEFPYVYPRLSKARNGLFLEGMVRDENGERNYAEEERIRREGLDTIRGLFEKFDNVILSDEVLWKAAYERRAELWEELRAAGEAGGYQVKIIVYLRRQDEYVSSWWNQMIKKCGVPLTTSWDEYRSQAPEDIQPDYYHTLSRIADVLGKENMIVRLFEPERFYGGTLESDFLHAIGLELTQEYTVPEDRSNLKLEGNTHEIKRILNTLGDIQPREDNFFRKSLMDFSGISGKDYPAGVLSAEESAEFMEPYLEGNRRIAEEYLGEDSDLFDMTYVDTVKWEKDNPYMVDDVIRFAGAANRKLLNMISEQDARIKKEREREKELEARIRKLEKKAIFKKAQRKLKKMFG